jgi:hypothetical protein
MGLRGYGATGQQHGFRATATTQQKNHARYDFAVFALGGPEAEVAIKLGRCTAEMLV